MHMAELFQLKQLAQHAGALVVLTVAAASSSRTSLVQVIIQKGNTDKQLVAESKFR